MRAEKGAKQSLRLKRKSAKLEPIDTPMRRLLTVTFLAVALAAVQVAGAQDLARADEDQRSRPIATNEPLGPHRVYAQGTRTVTAGKQYQTGEVGEALLGNEYRDVWSTSIQAPVIDLGRTAGGLTPTGAAGGVQTSLLFLEGEDGRHFILRKMDKDAGGALPNGTQRTIVEDVVQDQVSSLNPYSAFVIAPMAQAADVLHTSPQLVYIPDDPRLGEYREEFGNELGLLERKVDEDVTDAERFAYSEEVINFEDFYERTLADAEVHVDERAFARTRLFDMFIGDRDRHDEQWFFAAVDDGNRFLPIPIDRDFAFARFDGLLNKAGRFSGNTTLRKQTYFGDDIDNLVGLNHQGAKLDILFTSELDRDDWISIGEDLQASLTDDVIESAIRGWPDPVYDEIGEETIAALKGRRDDLPEAAEQYYELLMQKVDVVGSNENETFIIDRVSDEYTDLVIEHEGRQIYERRFLVSETDELRLYGLGGDDAFLLNGPANEGVRVFAVGGEGDDFVRTGNGERARDFRFYDVEVDDKTREQLGHYEELDDPSENEYKLHRYEFDRAGPAFAFDYDSDEGIYIGGGVKMVRYGFMREPYAARHVIVANYAPRSQGYNISYDGRINEIAGEWDATAEAEVLDFDEFDDFYGFGNDTPEGADERHLAHFRWVRAYPAMLRELGSGMSVSIGPYFEYADIEPPNGISEESPDPGLTGYTVQQFEDKYFGGVLSRFELDGRDTTALPTSGLRFFSEAGVHAGLRNSDDRFARFATELSYFFTPVNPATIALRVGGATNIGDFTFYQANTVGGRENLRGFSKTRFSGRTSAYANSELRLKLTDFNIYLTRGELGVFGFYDVGRVWADDEDSNLWHHGYGGGAWVTPFYQFLVRGSVGFSNEGRVFSLSTGMFF